jgi:YfiH family protein
VAGKKVTRADAAGADRAKVPVSASGCIPFVFPGAPAVGCAFSTIHAGSLRLSASPDENAFPLKKLNGPAELSQGEPVSPARNRKNLLEALGLARWVELKQVHGDTLVADPGATPPELPSTLEGDGACTREKDLALVIKTADCQPILITDLKGSAIAALHVGWRGNAANFPASGLLRFCETYALPPSEVLAVRGPSLGPAAAEFINFEREWPPQYRPWFNAADKTVDLWALTRHQLISAGMRPERIFSLDLCTRSLPGLFYSYRRGDCGRQASLVWIKGSS